MQLEVAEALHREQTIMLRHQQDLEEEEQPTGEETSLLAPWALLDSVVTSSIFEGGFPPRPRTKGSDPTKDEDTHPRTKV